MLAARNVPRKRRGTDGAGVVACGSAAKQAIDRFAAALGIAKPAGGLRAPTGDEALAWFHRSERAPCLVAFEPGITRKRELHPGVGQRLRRA